MVPKPVQRDFTPTELVELALQMSADMVVASAQWEPYHFNCQIIVCMAPPAPGKKMPTSIYIGGHRWGLYDKKTPFVWVYRYRCA